MHPSSRFASFGILALPLLYAGMLAFSAHLLWAAVAISVAAIVVRLIAALR